ncbi:MAG: hypothetical protein H0U82_12860 [Actinobacteria bacterium]|nr:hypothetical protein [Actinomycetota bacterium]
MRAKIGPMLMEARSVVRALRANLDVHLGPVLVSGTLSEQLARELAAGAAPGAVVAAHASRPGAAALVHVIAGEPTPADDELVRRADRQGVPVVLVQLEPQAQRKQSFVLTPFVVECRAGEGFPLPEIAGSLVDAMEYPVALARRVPVLQEAVTEAVLGTAAIRAAIIGALGARSKGTRPILVLEQVRMLGELRALTNAPAGGDALPVILGISAATLGAGLVFRAAARSAPAALPAPAVGAVVAAAGTWALGQAYRRLEAHIPSA